MVSKARTGDTAQRFVDATLELIEERGGSQDVNLREVARRVGIAHTNAYHYYDGFAGLLFEALRSALAHYAHFLSDGLDDGMEPIDYYRQVITNLVAYPRQHPGRYRFIVWDPIDDGTYPDDVIDSVLALKRWFVDVTLVCAPATSRSEAENACMVIDAYISGESASLLTGRTLPGDDIVERMMTNSLRLFGLLTAYKEPSARPLGGYPRLNARSASADPVSRSSLSADG